MMHCLHAWIHSVSAPTTVGPHSSFCDSFFATCQEAPLVFTWHPELRNLFSDAIFVFAEQVEPGFKGPGFARLMSLGYVWPCFRRIARGIAATAHGGTHIGPWIVDAFVPREDPLADGELSSLTLVWGDVPTNGATWLPENTANLRRLLRVATLRRLALAGRGALSPSREDLLLRLDVFENLLKERIRAFVGTVESPSTERMCQYWPDELR